MYCGLKSIGLLGCVAWSMWLGGPALAETKAVDLEVQVEQLLEQEGRVLDALDALDQKVLELRTLRDEITTQQAAIKLELSEMNTTLEEGRQELSTLEERLRIRLRVRSNLDIQHAHRRRLLFADGGQTDRLRRRGYLAAVVRSDLKLMNRYRVLDSQMVAQAQARQAALDALEAQTARLVSKTQEYEREKDLRTAALKGLKSRQDLLRKLLVQQADRQRALRLASAAGGGHVGDGILAQRGLLLHPTPHPVVIRFGMVKDPQTGTSVKSNGWTYRGPYGAPVQAIFSGIVVYSGWYMGFGQLLMIDHGQGYHSIYAHLSKLNVQKGDRVQQGDLVGRLGDTGSLRGPKLYFEFRENRKADNPARWLIRRP